MSAEFDTVAGWTAEVAAAMAPADRIPAACRGSSNPAALRWFLDRLHVRPGQTFLDCGAGTGGPAAFAAQEAGVRPVLTEPELGACRTARSLFGLPTIRADHHLPIRRGAVTAGWSLGVLCTLPDQAAFLTELRRILHPSGRFGLLVYAATHAGELTAPVPDGNSFPVVASLSEMLAAAALRIQVSARLDDFAQIPRLWQQAQADAQDRLRHLHGDTPAWQAAEQQSQRMAELLAAGDVVGVQHVIIPQ